MVRIILCLKFPMKWDSHKRCCCQVMACPTLGVPEMTACLCDLPNSDSPWMINPNDLEPPRMSETTNGLDPQRQQPNEDECPPIMVYQDTSKYDVCKGVGRRHKEDIGGAPFKILNPNALDPPITAHILNELDSPGRDILATHCTRT